MDIQTNFFEALLKAGTLEAFKKVEEIGVNEEIWEEPFLSGWKFITEYFSDFGFLPSRVVFAGNNPNMSMSGPVDPELAPVAYYAKALLKKALHTHIHEGVNKVDECLTNGDPYAALEALEAIAVEARKKQLSPARLKGISQLTKEVRALYERMKSGEKGIETPWETVNNTTLGLWAQDLMLVVGHTSVGKTFCLLLFLIHAYMKGERVVLVTTEMSQVRIMMRMIALYLGIPFSGLRKGKLDDASELRLYTGLKEIEQLDDRFWVVGGDFDFKLESLPLVIKEVNPSLMGVDGAYLLKTGGKDRFDKTANVFNGLKILAKMHNLAMIASMQFNREAKKGSAALVQVQNIAMTDVASWNADLIAALHQTDEMKADRRMVIKWLKARDVFIPDMEINWDIDNGNFEEIISEAKADEQAVEIAPVPGPVDQDGNLAF